MEKPVYIHYGAETFDPKKGFPIRNEQYWVKPCGGLWASRETASYGWKEWCEQENFRECDPLNSFRFVLRDGTKVAVISCMADLKRLPAEETSLKFRFWGAIPDFEECLRQGYDAIELCWYGEEYQEQAADDMHYALYGWDCDSIVVLNPEVIIQI